MKYNITYKRSDVKGIDLGYIRLTKWYHFNVCPKCGKKVTTCMPTVPGLYRCPCITDEEWNNR